MAQENKVEEDDKNNTSPVIVDDNSEKPVDVSEKVKEVKSRLDPKNVELESLVQQAKSTNPPFAEKTIMKEEIAAKRAGKNPDDVMDEIIAGGKAVKYGDRIITPTMIQQIRPERGNIVNKEAYFGIRAAINEQVGPKSGVIIPEFDEKTIEEKWHGYVPNWKRKSQTRDKINNYLAEQDLPDEVRQVFIEDYSFGTVPIEIKKRLQETGRALSVTLPSFVRNEGVAGVMAMYRSGTANIFSSEFKAEYDVNKADRLARADKWQDWMMINPFYTSTVARDMNSVIHTALEERFAESDPEKYDDLAFERDSKGQFLTDADGNRVKKSYITNSNAGLIANLAFDEGLTGPQRAATIIGEEALMLTLMGGGYTAARGAGRITKVLSYKKNPKYADALKGIDDPEDIIKVVELDLSFDASDKFFQAGLLQYRTNETATNLGRQIKNAESRLGALTVKTNRTPAEDKLVVQLRSQVKQLRQTRTRALVKGRYYPYVKDSLTNAAVIGAGASLIRESGWFFDDPNTREFAGLMFMSLGGYRLGGLGKNLIIGGKTLAAKTAPSIFEMSSSIVASVPLVGKILVDDTIKNVETTLGRKLDAEGRRNVEVIVGTMNKLDPRMRRSAMNAMEETQELYERIVNSFPEGASREEARELFLSTYANSTNLLSLAAAGALRDSEVNLYELSKLNIQGIETNLRETTRLVRATDMALDRFMELTGTIDDMEARSVIEQWVQVRKDGFANLKDNMMRNQQQQLESLDEVEKFVIKSGQLRPNDLTMRRALLNVREELQRSLGMSVDEAENIKNLDKKVSDEIDSAIEQATALRGSGMHMQSVNKAFEMFMDETIYQAYENGRAPYKALEGFMQGRKPIELSPVFEGLIQRDDYDGIVRYFGPESAIFDGAQGKLALQAFEDMMYKAIPRETLEGLRTEMSEAFVRTNGEQGIAPAAVNALSDHEFFLEVFRRHKRAGVETDFNPFAVANPYEIELMVRAFKGAGDAAERSQNSSLAREYYSFAKQIDTTIDNQDPQYFAKLKEARSGWERNVGLPTEEGTIIDDFTKSRKRLKNVADRGVHYGVFGTRALYDKDRTPVQLLSDLSNNFTEYMRPGGNKSILKVSVTMERITDSLGFVLPNGSRGFDLTTPEGQKRFAQLRALMTEAVASQTADKVLGSFQKIREKTGMRLTGVKGTFNADAIGDMEELTRLVTVPVLRMVDGKPKMMQESLIDVVDMYGSQNTLQRAVNESKDVREAFIELKDNFATQKKNAQSDINIAIAKEEDNLNIFRQSIEDMSASDFYSSFIESGEGGSLLTLKNNVVETYKAAGYSADDAEKAFKSVATTYAIQGMFEAAGVSAVSGKVVGGKTEKIVYQEFQSPEKLLAALANESVRQQLALIMDDKHVQFITDIVRFANDSHMTVKVSNVTGDFKGMSISSKISRAWNLARRVVNPAYIAADYAFQAARAGQIDIFKLALQDKEAARIMTTFFQPTELLVDADIARFNDAAKTFMFTELARKGNEMYLIDNQGEEETNEENE
jgi:hypothetical protein